MSSVRTHTTTTTGTTTTERAAGRTRTARGPWALICAVATVVLGPAAVTAFALDQANAAPPLHVLRADRTQAYIPSDRSDPSDAGRRRTA